MLACIEQASLVRRQALDDPFGSEADTSIKVSALSQSTPCNICQLPTAITHPRRRPEIPPQVMVRTHGDASAGPDVVLAAGAESDAADVLPPSRSVRWPLDCSQTVPSSAIETPLRAGSRRRQRGTDGTLRQASAGLQPADAPLGRITPRRCPSSACRAAPGSAVRRDAARTRRNRSSRSRRRRR